MSRDSGLGLSDYIRNTLSRVKRAGQGQTLWIGLRKACMLFRAEPRDLYPLDPNTNLTQGLWLRKLLCRPKGKCPGPVQISTQTCSALPLSPLAEVDRSNCVEY